MRRSRIFWLVGIALTMPTGARADVAPTPLSGCNDAPAVEIEEESCTINAMEVDGATCQACQAFAGDDCAGQFADTDFVYACESEELAGYRWQIWCDGPVPETGGCVSTGSVRPPATVPTRVGLLALVCLLGCRRAGRARRQGAEPGQR